MKYTGRVRALIPADDARLRKKSRPVAPEELQEPLFQQLVNDMIVTMIRHSGIGLAAVQIGVLKRVAVMSTAHGATVLVNPKIVGLDAMSLHGNYQEVSDEGCLSLPGETHRVSRLDRVTLRCLNGAGKKQRHTLDGLAARCAQHEIDHMDGVLISQRSAAQRLWKP